MNILAYSVFGLVLSPITIRLQLTTLGKLFTPVCQAV